MAKRGQGEGTIAKHMVKGEWDGTWWARISLGRDANGRRKRQAFYGKTRKEVQEKLTAALHGVHTDTYIEPSKMTVSEWLNTWLIDYKKNKIKPTTYFRYVSTFLWYTNPMLGDYRLKDLRPDIIQKYVNELTERGQKPGTVKTNFNPLNAALMKAVDIGLIAKNPADRVELPRHEKEEVRVLTAEEQAKLVQVAQDSRHGNFFLLALTTGLRCGELLGLIWDDIDFDNEILKVNRTQTEYSMNDLPGDEVKIRATVGTPKTKSSKRTVPLMPSAIKVLQDIKEKQRIQKEISGAAFKDNNLVFCTCTGNRVFSSKYRTIIKELCQKAGIESIHLHTLRHTFATRGLESGVELRVMQELLGHSSIKMTADLYTHVLPEKKKDSIMKLEDTFNL